MSKITTSTNLSKFFQLGRLTINDFPPELHYDSGSDTVIENAKYRYELLVMEPDSICDSLGITSNLLAQSDPGITFDTLRDFVNYVKKYVKVNMGDITVYGQEDILYIQSKSGITKLRFSVTKK